MLLETILCKNYKQRSFKAINEIPEEGKHFPIGLLL